MKIEQGRANLQPRSTDGDGSWCRMILLTVLGYEATGGLLGGSFLILAPDGALMNMPVTMMHGAFDSFLIPGLVLFGLGIVNTLAFISTLRFNFLNWTLLSLALGGSAIWFWVEIAILQQVHWLHAIWGLPVVFGIVAAVVLFPYQISAFRKALLSCGILASLLYAVINVIIARQWPGDSYLSQKVRELSAIGAPTHTLWNILFFPYNLLMMAFGWGVWKSAKENSLLRATGILLIAYPTLGILWQFVPVQARSEIELAAAVLIDTTHIETSMSPQLVYLPVLALAAAALGNPFRVYSIVTLLLLLFFGIHALPTTAWFVSVEPAQLIGLWERINIGIFLAWVIVLAIVLSLQGSSFNGH